MGFASLGSGSRGNGTVVVLGEAPEQHIFLIDCGFPLKQTEQRLARLGLSAGDLDAVLVSHEHADHISGVAALSHKYAVPVYASYGTARKARHGFRCHEFDGDVPFELNGVTVNPVRVPHDAVEPTQFVLGAGAEKIGVLSDLGCVTSHVVEQFTGCSHLLMEANHDRSMLMNGGYPPRLKRRVGADYGHLSNEQAWSLLDAVAHPQLDVVIGHVSEQNNHPDRIQQVFQGMDQRLASLQVATQQDGFDWVGNPPAVQRQLNRSTGGQISFGEVL